MTKESIVRQMKLSLLGLGVAAVIASTGCAQAGSPNVERVPVPAPNNPENHRYDTERPKPLPEDATLNQRSMRDVPTPPFEYAPLVRQRAPEQAQFER